MSSPARARRSIRGRAALRVCIAALSGLLAASSQAASYPERTVRIVAPYAPGGPADLFARIVAQQLAAIWRQPVIVDNRAGATGVIGTEAVVRSAPDGYTLLVGSGSTAIGATLESRLPYDTRKDLLPVSGLVSTPYFLFANSAFPANTVQGLIALAKAKPGEIAFGSAGNGGAPHLAGEMFNLLADTRLLHVPYKGTGPATTAMVAGEVQLMFGSLTSTNAYLKANRLKILGTADAKRSAFLPDVPTIAEAGVPGFEAENWFGLFAPSGTPDAVAKRISDAVAIGLADPDVKNRLWNMGAVPMPLPPKEFQAYFRRQVDLWERVVVERKLRKD
jgi:tripartite-type tricarboxylate transporter receptor subunit TctC